MTGKETAGLVLKPFISLYTSVFFLLTATSLLNTFLSLRLSMAGVDAQTTGLVLTIYYVGLTWGTFCCGPIIRQVGHIRAFSAFAAFSTAMVLIHGLHLSVPLWMGLRFVSGIANMGLFMVIESWLNECADTRVRGKVFSIYMIMTYVGSVLGQKVLTLADPAGQTLFLGAAVFMVFSIMPVALTRGIHPELPKREGIRLINVCKKAPIGMLGCFISGCLISAFYAMTPVFSHKIGLSVDALSWFMALGIFGGLVFQWPVGALSDRFDRTLMLPAMGLAMGLVALGLSLTDPDGVTVFLTGTLIFGGFMFSIYPVSVARAHDRFEPEDVVKVSAALLLAYGVGSMAGPMLSGMVITLSGSAFSLYYFYAGVSLGFMVICLGLRSLESVEIIAPEDQVDFVIMKRTSAVASHMDPRLETGEEEDELPGTALG